MLTLLAALPPAWGEGGGLAAPFSPLDYGAICTLSALASSGEAGGIWAQTDGAGNPLALVSARFLSLAIPYPQERGEEPAEGVPEGGEAGAAPALPGGPTPDLSALLGELDPRMLQIGMQVLREVQNTQDRSTALLNALRPFLREERRARLDKAIQIARVSRMIRAALEALGKKEGEGNV